MNAHAAAMLEPIGNEAVVLEEVRAEAVIRDLFADVVVTQRYRNWSSTAGFLSFLKISDRNVRFTPRSGH